MVERRLSKVENTLVTHDRRLTSTESSLALVLAWKASIEESTEVNKEMVEVGKNILEALRWVGVGARWIVSVAAAAGAVWMAIKGIIILAKLQ